MQVDWVLGLGMVLTAVVAVVGGFLVLYVMPARPGLTRTSIFSETASGAVFLFDSEVMVDSTPGARALLASCHTRGSPWVKLMSYLSSHYADLETQLLRLSSEGTITLASEPAKGEPILFHAESRGGLTRITLIDPERDERMPGQDPMAHRAQAEELALLRETITKAPVLIWRERADGEVVWANLAYLLRAADHLSAGKDLTWPLPRIFERTASTQGATGQRQRLGLKDGRSSWFELVSFAEGDGRLVFALPADAVVQAEVGLRDFMQTLTKTFAHLHVGLAIFDNQRQLQLFNPAMLDLTGLPPDFMSMRPSLLSVLDAMRDRSMIPEPKDYRDWRRQILEMEKAAASGLYEDTWSLPGGQTYRVIGRPHPNGALALMIEDISSEMLRTRRYRADLELGQSVIDELDQSIAVFSESGQLVMSNTNYAQLWGHDPSISVAEGSVRTLCAYWRSQSAPSPVWADVEEFVANPGDRKTWNAETRLLDGRMVACRFAPLSGGATLASFRLKAPASVTQTKVTKGAARRSA